MATALTGRPIRARAGRPPAHPVPQQRAPEGVVTAVVAVTGIEDHVKDVIVPGAFSRTLRVRRPKVCWHHSWTDPIGRVLHIEELMPGDPRLPKRQKDGTPWPADAGALIATMQLNLAIERARTAYEWIRWYSDSAECEFSIGYKVVPGKASKGRDDTRFIYDLDVFEISFVLFGAASQTMTVEIKAATQHAHEAPYWRAMGASLSPATAAVMEAKSIQPSLEHSGVKVAGLVVVARDTGRALMLQRALNATDPASGTWEFPGGHVEPGETPRDAAVREWSEETGLTLPAGSWAGSWDAPGGHYRGHIYTVRRESAVLPNAARQVANPDDPNDRRPEVAAWFRIPDLARMAALRAECRDTDWSLLTNAAGEVQTRRDGRLETKGAAAAVAAAKQLIPAPPNPMETKAMQNMNGSYEHRRDLLLEAVTTALCKDAPGTYAHIEATFNDRVIATCGSEAGCTSYEIAYQVEGDQVVLDQPIEVTLDVVAEPSSTETADAAVTTDVRFTTPVAGLLDQAAALLMLGPVEGKSLGMLVAPALRLMDALAVKGMDVNQLVDGDDEDEGDDADWAGLIDEPTDAEPAAPAQEPADADADDEDEDEDPIVNPDPVEDEPGDQDLDIELDPEVVQAELAALRDDTTA